MKINGARYSPGWNGLKAMMGEKNEAIFCILCQVQTTQ